MEGLILWVAITAVMVVVVDAASPVKSITVMVSAMGVPIDNVKNNGERCVNNTIDKNHGEWCENNIIDRIYLMVHSMEF